MGNARPEENEAWAKQSFPLAAVRNRLHGQSFFGGLTVPQRNKAKQSLVMINVAR